MRLDLLSVGALAAVLAVGRAEGQSPSAAIPQALRALTRGFGGCLGDVASRDVQLSFFPDVHFVRGTCVLEHGDTTTALVGLDRDSVLYLASSVQTLKFLVLRHPPTKLDGTNVVAYAQQALEVAGLASGEARLLRAPEDVPDYARRSMPRKATPLISVTPQFGGKAWDVRLTFREPGGYYRAAIVQHSFWLFSSGEIEAASSEVVWSDPRHQ